MLNRRHRPKGGDRYVVKKSFTAILATYWFAPCTGGGDVFLPAGLEFVVEEDPEATASGASAKPEPAAHWEAVFIAEETLSDAKFAGWSLKIGFDELAKYCARL